LTKPSTHTPTVPSPTPGVVKSYFLGASGAGNAAFEGVLLICLFQTLRFEVPVIAGHAAETERNSLI
jgi:hypothetical protein